MSNTKKKHLEPEAGPKQPNAELASTSTERRLPKPLATIALLLSMIALAGLAYLSWRGFAIEQHVTKASAQIQQLESQLSRQLTQLNAARDMFAPINQETENISAQYNQLRSAIDNLSNKVRSIEGSSLVSLHLAEIEYLLRLANQRLLMLSDIRGAKSLLASADDMLLALDDYNLYPIREALKEDIAILSVITEFDQEGIYLRLQSVTEHFQALRLYTIDQFHHSDDRSDTVPTLQRSKEQDWQDKIVTGLLQAWGNFKELFRFTADRRNSVVGLLSPQQESIVREHLRLLIEQSKLALLSGQQALYENCLAEAKKWLIKYFSQSSAEAQSVLEELSSLAKIVINPDVPGINRALEALKHYQLQSAVQINVQAKKEKAAAPAEDSASLPAVQVLMDSNAESEEPQP